MSLTERERLSNGMKVKDPLTDPLHSSGDGFLLS
jgi:hypothetical protein